jgi:hypothetical protein
VIGMIMGYQYKIGWYRVILAGIGIDIDHLSL